MIDLLHQLTHRLSLRHRARHFTPNCKIKKSLPIHPLLVGNRQHFSSLLDFNRTRLIQNLQESFPERVRFQRSPHGVLSKVFKLHCPSLRLTLIPQRRNQPPLLRKPILHLRQLRKDLGVTKSRLPCTRFPDPMPCLDKVLQRPLHALLSTPQCRLPEGMIEVLALSKSIP